ncbi:MAG: PilZ domain-containing protein [Candidatus Omnitrophica bacterium]|nr:PilZ domain-containing protein [Candidatus Omnitrophota bacterium]
MTRSAKKIKKVKKLIERRGALRAERVVAIRHRLHQSVLKRTEESWSLSSTHNMSLTGLLFSSEIPYAVGDILEVSVTLSVIVDIFQGFGEVTRVDEKSGRCYEIAVRFVQLKTPTRNAASHM